HKPAAAYLDSVQVHAVVLYIRGGSRWCQASFHYIVAACYVQVLVASEAIHQVGAQLSPGTVCWFIVCAQPAFAFRLLKVAEELQAAELHEGVHYKGRDAVGKARVDMT